MRNAKSLLLLGALPLGILLLAGTLTAYRGGTSGRYSGAPGEGTCHNCHRSFPINSGSATFSITSPGTLVGQGNLDLQLAFAGSSFPRHGFELTMRDGSGSASGTWTITDPNNTQAANSSHVTHTRNGSGRSSWTTRWTPPASLPPGPITFYSAGLEANGSGTSGDYVYTTTTTVYQAELATANSTWPLGSTQTLDVHAPTQPGAFYVIALSDSTNPTPLGGAMILPVDLSSPLFSLILQGVPFFQNFLGALDGAGRAQGAVLVPNLPFLSGMNWHFAFATLNAAATVTEVSNRVSIQLQ